MAKWKIECGKNSYIPESVAHLMEACDQDSNTNMDMFTNTDNFSGESSYRKKIVFYTLWDKILVASLNGKRNTINGFTTTTTNYLLSIVKNYFIIKGNIIFFNFAFIQKYQKI